MEDVTISGDAAVKIGVIGCGKISGIYLENGATFDDVEIVACSDLVLERAEAQAQEYGVPKAYSPEELLADEEVEIVLNLTVPVAHAEVSLAALEAGKHVYTEKPLAVSLEDGWRMLEVAAERDLRIGCAPDTFLGGGLQTCRKIMDEGIIGEPVAVWAESQARIDLYGTEGTLSLPDPNFADGPVRLWRSDTGTWKDVPLTHTYTGNSGGIGLADMAQALRSGRPHRATGELGMHVLEVIHAFLDSSERGEHVAVESTFERPEPLPARAPEGIFGGGV